MNVRYVCEWVCIRCVHSHTVPLSLFGRSCPSLFFTHHFRAGWHNTSLNSDTHKHTQKHSSTDRPFDPSHGTSCQNTSDATLNEARSHTWTEPPAEQLLSSSAHTHTERLPRTRVSFSPSTAGDDSETQEKQLAGSLRPSLGALRGDRSQSAWCQCCS